MTMLATSSIMKPPENIFATGQSSANHPLVLFLARTRTPVPSHTMPYLRTFDAPKVPASPLGRVNAPVGLKAKRPLAKVPGANGALLAHQMSHIAFVFVADVLDEIAFGVQA